MLNTLNLLRDKEMLYERASSICRKTRRKIYECKGRLLSKTLKNYLTRFNIQNYGLEKLEVRIFLSLNC